ncbi:hypothetical protein CGLO_14692 [Colletotrichum gloeosporioides Cg-14]|uniref:Uncharacterized protein n=1 Tax=Colletotrichum gloeosporioides (strain Cg-14) TaxID=1237896 RepID=T0LD65_COLGC|nr:hypothetical protein CGLO_14692 [Colletotrichum gloeosporioides Cg-14]
MDRMKEPTLDEAIEGQQQLLLNCWKIMIL